jgi:hypothetical protein
MGNNFILFSVIILILVSYVISKERKSVVFPPDPGSESQSSFELDDYQCRLVDVCTPYGYTPVNGVPQCYGTVHTMTTRGCNVDEEEAISNLVYTNIPNFTRWITLLNNRDMQIIQALVNANITTEALLNDTSNKYSTVSERFTYKYSGFVFIGTIAAIATDGNIILVVLIFLLVKYFRSRNTHKKLTQDDTEMSLVDSRSNNIDKNINKNIKEDKTTQVFTNRRKDNEMTVEVKL